MALRLAFAGKRVLAPGEGERIEGLLRRLFGVIEARLVELGSGRAMAGRVGAGWHAAGGPRLSLVSGLADGADQIASDVFLSGAGPAVERTIAAVLPFPRDVYPTVSPMTAPDRYRRLLSGPSTGYVLELDGDPRTDLPDGDALARNSRAAAYRAQADMMLRHADLLVAVDNHAVGGAGGTSETVQLALGIGMPVVRFLVGQDCAAVLRSEDDREQLGPAGAGWEAEVERLVDELVAGPLVHGNASPEARYEEELISEFFGTGRPPRSHLLKWTWRWFARPFRRGRKPGADATLSPIEAYRTRANLLNHHYAGMYRGTFVLGYVLAWLAVTLAILSLVVLVIDHAPVTAATETGVVSAPAAHAAADKSHGPHFAWFILFALGAAKLVIVVSIQLLSRGANSRRWSERAVDYRYLAEGLRIMAYLTRAGSYRPPPPLSVPFATRVATQSTVDRLFHTIVRQVSPGPPPGQGDRRVRIDAAAALDTIRKGWIANQRAYHEGNAGTMAAMSRGLERISTWLGRLVIGVVAIDLIVLLLELSSSPDVAATAKSIAPWLLFSAGILPAAIASLNGIRFQSECGRLADRSTRMLRVLDDLDRRATALAAWPADVKGPLPLVRVMRLSEDVARIMLDEVADWSALYAKEIVEPG